jgi:MFS family permease
VGRCARSGCARTCDSRDIALRAIRGTADTRAIRSAIRTAASVIVATLGNRALRRVALGYALFSALELAVWIAMLVYAYDQGGATAAGVVAVVQLAPAALFAPIGGLLADRRPEAALVGGYAVQAVAMGATAAALLGGGPPALAYALAALVTSAITVTRPAQAVLAPGMARTPEELTAFNVLVGWIESAAVLVGPALTGVVLVFGSPGVVFAFSSALGLLAALLVLPLAWRREPVPEGEPEGSGAIAEILAGFRAVAGSPRVRLLVLFLVAQCVALGAFDVLAVVLAIDVLGIGESGAGYLNAALGAGGVIGAVATLTLIGRRRLVPPLVLGALCFGAAFVLLGAYPAVAAAFVLLAVAGAGSIVSDVAGRTLLQRVAPPNLLARVFALYEALSQVGIAAGAILVPALIAVGGAKAALIATGVLLPALILVRYRALHAIDVAATVPIVEISLLRTLPIFAPLPAPTLESLGRSVEHVRLAAGEAVIREGEVGDRFYAIADGEVEVTRRGERLGTRGRGEGFGEIALLHDVPRTATVTARTETLLLALDREPFVVSVTGHAAAARAAEQVVRERTDLQPASVE